MSDSKFDTPIGVVVHIGAGTGQSLKELVAERPDHIMLIEPHPETVARLHEAVKETKRNTSDLSIEVINAAVSQQTGQSPFYMLNFTDLSSLCQPTALTDLMQGVRVEQTMPVKTLRLADMLENVTFQNGKRHRLILEAPGMEMAILKDCAATGLFDRFEDIHVSVGIETYFDGAADSQHVLEFLFETGYVLLAQDETADPDWPHFSLHRNPVSAKLSEVVKTHEIEKEKLQKQLSEATQVGQNAEEALKEQATAAEAEKKRSQEQLAQATQERDFARQQTKDVERILKERNAKAEAELAKTYEHEQQSLQKQLEQALTEQKTLSEKLSSLEQEQKTKLADGAVALAASEASFGVLRAKLEAAETLRAEAEDKATRAYNEQVTAEREGKRELAMALRLQTLQQQDLAELQQRYAAAQVESRKQEDLLIKLTQKLGSAAGYLHGLTDDSPTPERISQPAPRKNTPKKRAPAKVSGEAAATSQKTTTAKTKTKAAAKPAVRKKSGSA